MIEQPAFKPTAQEISFVCEMITTRFGRKNLPECVKTLSAILNEQLLQSHNTHKIEPILEEEFSNLELQVETNPGTILPKLSSRYVYEKELVYIFIRKGSGIKVARREISSFDLNPSRYSSLLASIARRVLRKLCEIVRRTRPTIANFTFKEEEELKKTIVGCRGLMTEMQEQTLFKVMEITYGMAQHRISPSQIQDLYSLMKQSLKESGKRFRKITERMITSNEAQAKFSPEMHSDYAMVFHEKEILGHYIKFWEMPLLLSYLQNKYSLLKWNEFTLKKFIHSTIDTGLQRLKKQRDDMFIINKQVPPFNLRPGLSKAIRSDVRVRNALLSYYLCKRCSLGNLIDVIELINTIQESKNEET